MFIIIIIVVFYLKSLDRMALEEKNEVKCFQKKNKYSIQVNNLSLCLSVKIRVIVSQDKIIKRF